MPHKLHLYRKPELTEGKLILSFSGWMNGGDVSTGTIEYLTEKFEAHEFARIDPEGYYIYNFPGTMEFASMFRPYVSVKDGMIRTYQPPADVFYCSDSANLVFFEGKEPHLNWVDYTDCIISLCEQLNINDIYFTGSVTSLVPHTREPKILCTVSKQEMKKHLKQHFIKFTDYEGPASIVNYIMTRCSLADINMASLITEIPAYVQGYNPKCIETSVKALVSILGLDIHIDGLQSMTDDFEKKLSSIVADHPELEEKIQVLEQEYDDEVFNTELTDLKDWLLDKGIRID